MRLGEFGTLRETCCLSTMPSVALDYTNSAVGVQAQVVVCVPCLVRGWLVQLVFSGSQKGWDFSFQFRPACPKQALQGLQMRYAYGCCGLLVHLHLSKGFVLSCGHKAPSQEVQSFWSSLWAFPLVSHFHQGCGGGFGIQRGVWGSQYWTTWTIGLW